MSEVFDEVSIEHFGVFIKAFNETNRSYHIVQIFKFGVCILCLMVDV